MPKPLPNETLESFVTRFITDNLAILEFENLDQRVAVAQAIYDNQ